jgi:hypothetical protein
MAEINLIKLSQSGGGPSLVDVNFNGTLEGQADTTIPVEVNLTDGVNPVVPTSVALTGNDLDIVIPAPVVPSGVLFQFPTPSQYTSYRTGDEGWRVQNNWYDYSRPTNPKTIAELDYISANFWYLLKNNLVVGGVSNKTRFVDVDGGQTWSATGNKNLLIIDKLTGLGIYRNTQPTGDLKTWNAAIDDGLSLSITVNSVVYDEWYLISVQEFFDLLSIRFKQNNWIDSNTSNVIFPTRSTGSFINYWVSTTLEPTTSSAYGPRVSDLSFGELISTAKTDTRFPIYITKQTMSLITAP